MRDEGLEDTFSEAGKPHESSSAAYEASVFTKHDPGTKSYKPISKDIKEFGRSMKRVNEIYQSVQTDTNRYQNNFKHLHEGGMGDMM